MGLFKGSIICCFYGLTLLFGSEEIIDKRHLLFLLHHQQVEKAFTKYQELASGDRDDFDLLQQLCLLLLENGSKSQDKEIQLLSMIGAGAANSSKSLSILENGLRSTDPQSQLLALHFLQNLQDDKIDFLLTEAMKSDFLPIRMEAAYLMSGRRHPHAVGQIDALMHRLPPQAKAYFPVFFSLIGTPEATSILKTLMNDEQSIVRIEAIINTVQMNRDDLLPLIRKRITHGNVGELEASTYALGKLKDTSCTQTLEKLASSPNANVHLAANFSLCQLGDMSKKEEIEKMALQKNIFAITALSELPETENLLYKLCLQGDLQIRTNAAIALLMKHDPRCLPFLSSILISDEKDFALQPIYSVGRAFLAWKILPSAQAQVKDTLFDIALSHTIKEYLLKETIELPEEAFLSLAERIFMQKQNSLIPQLITLLENLGSDKAILLLKKQLTAFGSPLIRDYCHLALFRMGQEGIYEAYVNNWVLQHKNDSLTNLNPSSHRPQLPKGSTYQLTTEEKTRLLIDMFTALAAKQNAHTLVEALIKGNPKNRYLLAGLLLKAIE